MKQDERTFVIVVGIVRQNVWETAPINEFNFILFHRVVPCENQREHDRELEWRLRDLTDVAISPPKEKTETYRDKEEKNHAVTA